jgi:hypothetical protein
VETTSVNCNNCGAPLKVGPGISVVTCKHCASRLAVKRTESVAYTEMMEKIDRMTGKVAEQIDELARQNELAKIDREWEQERQAYMVTDKQGGRHIPTVGGGWAAVCLMATLGLVWLVSMRRFMQPPPQFTIFVIVFAVAAVVGGLWRMNKAQEYQAAKARYEKRRTAVILGWPDESDSGRK